MGLDFEQLRSFHWKPTKQLDLFNKELDAALDEAIGLRQQILELADKDDKEAQREKERLLWDAQDALDRVRLIGDLVVGAFFAHEKDKDRETERVRRLDLAKVWLSEGGVPPEELLVMQQHIKRRTVPFHWMAEFPEVFYEGRHDPLDPDGVSRAAYMDGFVGNPPFMGGSKISGALGNSYPDWLKAVHPSAEGRGDLSAHFLWRSYSLLGVHGAAGLIGTNSIAQGDTRETGLLPIVQRGGHIYDATPTLFWPGAANVAVAIVHFALGAPARVPTLRRVLDGREVKFINSLLRPSIESTDPAPLSENDGLCYRGNMLNGAGFVLTPEERDNFLAIRPGNGKVIFPYLGGEEINTSPIHSFHRYVINFGKRDLADVSEWPELLERVRTLVKPGRDSVRDNTGKGGHGKKYWWQFLDRCDPLLAALRPLSRCLVVARVTKHLVFAWQPTDRVLSDALFVFALDQSAHFACLQSRAQEVWARLLSSSMRDDLRYTANDCFQNFPFR